MYLLLTCLHILVVIFEMYVKGAELDKLVKYAEHNVALPLIFCSLVNWVARELRPMHPKPAAPNVVELDGTGLTVPALHSPELPMTPVS